MINRCFLYGTVSTTIGGKTRHFIYDYRNNTPRLKSEMTKDEKKLSEKAMHDLIKEGYEF